jgi:SAM-dependent methyltransferase
MSDKDPSAPSFPFNGSLSPLVCAKLKSLAACYDDPSFRHGWAAQGYHEMLAHYYNLQIPPGASVLEIGCGDGRLLSRLHAGRRVGVDLSERLIHQARERIPDGTFYVQAGERLILDEQFDCIVVSETINSAADVQLLFQCLQGASHARTRLIVNFFNNLWQPLSALATWVGMRARQPETNWLSTADVQNLMTLSGWEPLTTAHRILFPFRLPLIDFLFNRCLAPLAPPACLSIFCVARPMPVPPVKAMTVSVVIPARNEAGNIEAAVRRTPEMGTGMEIIFVEGNSTDHTWAEIQRVAQVYPERKIRCLQQSGVGKGDAVRAGFTVATGDILMILDADLTVQPEELPKFYQAIASGRAEFGNGVRLVYPMQQQAMRFLNLCANKAFGLIFSWLLGQSIKDTLCGTKVMLRRDYERLAAGRDYFGDFDPFGDFDLLFGVGKLGLSITDIPIRYCDRTYGTTNIKRWQHGWLLLRMVIFAARKLKFI